MSGCLRDAQGQAALPARAPILVLAQQPPSKLSAQGSRGSPPVSEAGVRGAHSPSDSLVGLNRVRGLSPAWGSQSRDPLKAGGTGGRGLEWLSVEPLEVGSFLAWWPSGVLWRGRTVTGHRLHVWPRGGVTVHFLDEAWGGQCPV